MFAIVLCLITSDRKIHDKLVFKVWSGLMLFALNVKLEVEGEENLSDEGSILLFNHSSLFDIPVIVNAVNKTFRFGSKTELFKIPFFGRAMKSLEVLRIHRGDRAKVLKLYSESIPKLKDGLSFILAPEGSRHRGETLNTFKSGPFIFAIEAQAPVLPILLIGVGDILPKKKLFPMWGLWSHKVKVKILPPISTSGLTQDDRKELQDKVFGIMKSTYDQEKIDFIKK